MALYNKHFDTVIVGKGIPSFLLASDHLLLRKRVMWLDDPRMRFGLFGNSIGFLDKSYLRDWGEERNIPPLKEIDKYTSRISYFVKLDHREFRFGDSPLRNLVELSRKMGGLFYSRHADFFNQVTTDPEFRNNASNELAKYATLLSKRIWALPEHREINFSIFEKDMPKFLLEIFVTIRYLLFEESEIGAEELWDWRHLMLLLRSRIHSRYSLVISDVELIHLILMIALPSYKIDEERLFNDSIHFFKKHGGTFLEAELHDWQVNSDQVWCLELSNYIGTIFPEVLYFLGGVSDSMPFTYKREHGERLRSVKVKLAHPMLRDSHTLFNDVIYSTHTQLGTSQPFINFRRLGSEVEAIYFYIDELGLKIDNNKDKIFHEVVTALTVVCDLAPKDWEFLKFTEEKDIIYMAKGDNAFGKSTLLTYSERPKLYDNNCPSGGGLLKKAEYISELTEGALGQLSLYHYIRLPEERF